MFDPSEFTTHEAKPIPVCLLLDVSGSMIGSKIDNQNKAVQEMLDTFAEEEKMETEILVSVITFGNEVKLHVPFTKASQVKWNDLQAKGRTPMGAALKMAKATIEDKETTPSRAYCPMIVLVSDGQPNDTWERPLEDFINEGRSSKCFCMALAIGHDADEQVLSRFIEKTPFLAKEKPNKVFYAENAAQLHEFFQFVTMTTIARSRSKNPNEVPAASDIKLDGASAHVFSEVNGSGHSHRESDEEGYY